MDKEYQEMLLIKLVKEKGLHQEDTSISQDERLELWFEVAQRCMYISADECQTKWNNIRTEYERDKKSARYRHGLLNFLDNTNTVINKEVLEESQLVSTVSEEAGKIFIDSHDNTLNDNNISKENPSNIHHTSSTMDWESTEVSVVENNTSADDTLLELQCNAENELEEPSKDNFAKKQGIKRKSQDGFINHNNEQSDIQISTKSTELVSSTIRRLSLKSKSSGKSAETHDGALTTENLETASCTLPLLIVDKDVVSQIPENSECLNLSTSLLTEDQRPEPESECQENLHGEEQGEIDTSMTPSFLEGGNKKVSKSTDKINISAKPSHTIDLVTEIAMLRNECIATDTRNVMDNAQDKSEPENNKAIEEKLLTLIKEMNNESFYDIVARLVCHLPIEKQKELRLKIGMLLADAEIKMLRNKMPE